MTKLRPPVSIENALFQVLGEIGLEQAAAVVDREPGYLRSLSDPDKRYRLTVEDAIALDLAFFAGGGGTMPIYETYGLLLDAARAERFACQTRLANRTIDAIRETGEAEAALVAAIIPGAGEAERKAARREVEQAIAALSATLPGLDDKPPPEPPP